MNTNLYIIITEIITNVECTDGGSECTDSNSNCDADSSRCQCNSGYEVVRASCSGKTN